MYLSPTVEEIIEIAKAMPFIDTLTYLSVSLQIVDFSREGYGRIKQFIQERQNEGLYAFVPNKSEANLLLNFEKEPTYNQLSLLIPNYRYIDLLRTGMLIDYYHKHDNIDNRDRVKDIKFQLSSRPNAGKILKIVDLPTTPWFETVIKYLYELKKEGYAPQFLEEQFDAIIEHWEKSSKLVRKEDQVEDIISFCKGQIIDKQPFFFILGMRSASYKIEKCLSELENEKYLRRHGYRYKLTKSREGNNPRTEIMFFKN